MVEFGAKLSLKDNMSATLIRNLKLQQDFSQQISQTNASVRELGRAKVNTAINATDNASDVIGTVQEGLNATGGMVASPELSPTDNASDIIEVIKALLDNLSSTIAAPTVRADDEATDILDSVREGVTAVDGMSATINAEDNATETIRNIQEAAEAVADTRITPVATLNDEASKGGSVRL